MGMTLHRGDVVICVSPGDYEKPRPAVIVQSDLFNPTHRSIVVCPITSHRINAPLFRLNLDPSKHNGIKTPLQIMVDKVMAIKTDKIRKKVGKLSPAMNTRVDHALRLWLNV